MRRPAEEGDPFIVLHRLLGLGEHAGFRGFDQLEAFEIVLGLGDHVENDAVAVVAGLDAVDLAVELVLELAEVGQRLDAAVGDILRHDDAIARALEILADRLDRAVVGVGLHVVGHRRHPVAEEDVDVLVLQRGVGDRHGEHLDVRLVAERGQEHRGNAGGRLDVGPADIGKAHGLQLSGSPAKAAPEDRIAVTPKAAAKDFA